MELIIEFAWFVVQGIFWYFVIMLLTLPIRRRMEEQQDQLEEAIEQLAEVVHVVNVEQHGDCYYWFDADSDQFLAQGKTTDETVTHLKSRFPKHIFFVSSKDKHYKVSAPNWEFVPVDLGNLALTSK